MTTLPEQLAHQKQLSAQQLEQRRTMNDDLAAPRPVDHSGIFPDRKSAVAASEELANAGYETQIADDGGNVLLEARKVSAIDGDTVDGFTKEVLTVFQRFGGDYDGWGGPIVTSMPQAPALHRSWIERLIRPRK